MLSVCITSHNNNLESLTNRLLEQCNLLNIKTEIRIADASYIPITKDINNAIAKSIGATYYQFSPNTSEGKIKNHLAQKAQYPYLLFINGSMHITHKNYLQKYVEVMQPGLIVNGGITAIGMKPKKEQLLHWQAMKHFYTHDTDVRSQFPFYYLNTNNLLIPRGLFLQDPMPESHGQAELLNYFFYLKQLGLSVIHIENPLSTKVFLTTKRFLSTNRNQLRELNTWIKEKWETHRYEIDLPEQKQLQKIEQWQLLKLLMNIYAIQTQKLVKNAHKNKQIKFRHYRNFRRWLILKEGIRKF